MNTETTFKLLQEAIANVRAAQEASRHAIYMDGTDFHGTAAIVAAEDAAHAALIVARNNHTEAQAAAFVPVDERMGDED